MVHKWCALVPIEFFKRLCPEIKEGVDIQGRQLGTTIKEVSYLEWDFAAERRPVPLQGCLPRSWQHAQWQEVTILITWKC